MNSIIFQMRAITVFVGAATGLIGLEAFNLAAKAETFLGGLTEDREVTSLAQSLERAIVSAENSQSAYLVHGRAADLADYQGAVREAREYVASIDRIVRAGVASSDQLKVIPRFAQAELAELARRENDRGDPDKISVANERLRRIQLSHSVSELSVREARGLEIEASRLTDYIGRGRWVVSIAVTVVALILISALLKLTRQLRGSFRALLGAMRETDGDGVPRAVAEELQGEFEDVGQAFEVMRLRIHSEIAQHTEAQSRISELLDQSGMALADQLRKRDILARMSNRLPACLNLEELVLLATRFIPQLFEVGGGALYFLNNSGTLLTRVMTWGTPVATIADFAPDQCWALRRGQQHHVPDASTDIPCAHLSDGGPDGYICMPLLAQGDTVGLLYLEWQEEQAKADPQAIEDMKALCENLALALVNLRLRETLRHQSLRDSLTGLYNRRYLDEAIELEFAKAQRGERALSVLMLDIDHFKRINDQFGHDAGDLVLSKVAQELSSCLRQGDIACRFGGEEFLVLLPETAMSEALVCAEKLRRSIACLRPTVDGNGVPVTISIGVASYPHDGTEPDAVVKAADKALYNAKASGRNRACSADPAQEAALSRNTGEGEHLLAAPTETNVRDEAPAA